MLTRLHIRDFALIQEVAIEFGAGFNVITGETGAGKSILMGALYSILGGTAGADLVRTGADRCLVEGIFELPDSSPATGRLRALGIELEDGQLVVRREVLANGRSRAYLNGLAVPLRALRQAGGVLVDLHGQHDHQTLLDPQQHTGFLDAFGGLGPAAAAVSAGCHQLRQAQLHLDGLHRDRQRLREQEQLRQFQLAEIRALAPTPGEDERVRQELELLTNAEMVLQTCTALFDLLYQADGSIVEQLGRGRRELERLVRLDPSLGEAAKALEELVYRVEDLSGRLRDYARRLEVQPQRLEELRERLEALRRLRKKYGGSLEAALQLAAELEEQEQRTGALDSQIEQAQLRSEQTRAGFAAACLALSDQRDQATRALAAAVERGLRDLGMPQVKFQVELRRQPADDGLVEAAGRRWQAGPGGLEQAEFIIAPNPGEDARPLARIASGGEISRVMLALKEVIAERDTVSTLVFDEIDVGISGRIAAAVGRKLRSLSDSHQLIVITHLPQIASAAACHFAVRKHEQDGRTVTQVQPVSGADRTAEIAHLLAGDTVSAAALRNAQEMLG
jgi:DNA repair protein RecN (Recombination protein N)